MRRSRGTYGFRGFMNLVTLRGAHEVRVAFTYDDCLNGLIIAG